MCVWENRCMCLHACIQACPHPMGLNDKACCILYGKWITVVLVILPSDSELGQLGWSEGENELACTKYYYHCSKMSASSPCRLCQSRHSAYCPFTAIWTLISPTSCQPLQASLWLTGHSLIFNCVVTIYNLWQSECVSQGALMLGNCAVWK